MTIKHSTGESPTESILIDQVKELSEKYDTLRNRCNNVLELGLKFDGIVNRITALEKKTKQVRITKATPGSSNKKRK